MVEEKKAEKLTWKNRSIGTALFRNIRIDLCLVFIEVFFFKMYESLIV